jgi:hypothetical protein
VSNISEEDALKSKTKRIYLATVPRGYSCVDYSFEEDFKELKDYRIFKFSFIVPITQKKLRELYLTDEEYNNLLSTIK